MLGRMEVDLESLARQVRDVLDAYVIPEPHLAALGTPLHDAWFAAELAAMKAALVAPFWTKMRDLDPQTGKVVILRVAIVAEDSDGYLVAFDPLTKAEFVLASREIDPEATRGVDAVSCGVRGDAVGCFLSR
jgi:hypothetical protein